MPAHNADLNDPKNVLRVLLSLVLENGGELRLRAATFDSIDRGRLLTVDYDKKKNQLVLRATSDFGRAIVVQPENVAWVQPPNTSPLERPRLEAEREVERSSVKTDEELAELEDRKARVNELARLAKEGKTPLRLSVRK
jgi:hypothetical protein